MVFELNYTVENMNYALLILSHKKNNLHKIVGKVYNLAYGFDKYYYHKH